MEKSWRSPEDGGFVVGERWSIHDPQVNLANLDVLVVEDGDHMRRLLKEVLRSLGCRNVRTTRNGKDAVAALANRNPDIVITDLLMSPVDGFALTKYLRSDGTSPNPFVPIIMLTGYTSPELVLKARNLGVTELLAKPVSANSLYERIRHVVLHPRSFVKIDTYFGPDRRRLKSNLHVGPDRRTNGSAALLDPSVAQPAPTPAADDDEKSPGLVWSRTDDADHGGWKRWQPPTGPSGR